MKKLIVIASLSALIAFGQQNTLTHTITTAAMTATDRSISVSSATGITAGDSSAGTVGTQLFVVDVGQTKGELMTVMSISGTVLRVNRTAGGVATAHASGAMVLAGQPQWFRKFDPVGSCVTATTNTTPTVNTINGLQWICSAKTLTWIPGWGNFSAPPQINAATAVASVAGTTTIDGPLVHISGTNAITAFQPGIGWNGEGFCVIPDGAFTTTTGGTTVASTRVIAIGIASTAVANKTLCFTYDATNAKFNASY